MAKGLLTILAIFVFAFSTGASARNLSAGASSEDSGKTVSASGGSHLRVFRDPDTGEILTYEQWQSFDFEDQRAEHSHSDSAEAAEEAPKRTLEVKTVTLPDGRQVRIVKTPEWMKSRTRVRFDEKGKAHLICD